MRTSSFPVRKENKNVIVLDLSSGGTAWEANNSVMAANFHNGNTTSGNKRVLMTPLGNHKYSVSIPTGYAKVEWLRLSPTNIEGNALNYKNAETFSSNNKYSVTSITGNMNDTNVTGSWSNDTTLAKGHTYYEYDSTDGKDNAFITDINQGSTPATRTAKINYYDDPNMAVKSQNNLKGFFPFDYNNIIKSGITYPTDTIYVDVSSVNDSSTTNYYGAYLFGNGNTATWITLTQHNGNIYKFDNTKGYEKVILTRAGTAADAKDFDNSWNRTGDVTIPTGSDNKTTIKLTYNTSGTYGNRHMDSSLQATSGLQPIPNGYAQSDQTAHDLGFGMKLEIPFTLNANGLNEDGTAQTFDFSGDDDLWVFIDNKLVLDLGGAHGVTTGSINFNTMLATAYSAEKADTTSGPDRNGDFSNIINTTSQSFNPNEVHTMTIYYMERGMFDSNLKFGFSFHAIPKQFKTEKKIRTRVTSQSDYSVNSGFYTINDTTRSDFQVDKNTEPRYVTWFEKSYQSEQFTVEHKIGNALINSTPYTINNPSHGTSSEGNTSSGTYTIKNDDTAYFLDQFTSGDTFTIKETPANTNKYVYDQHVSVYDDANNKLKFETISSGTPAAGQAIGDATTGYTFKYSPTTAVSGGLENLNLRATFENSMITHDLIVTKNVSEESDKTSEFTLQFKFNFDVTGSVSQGYIPYPLYASIDGTAAKLDDEGKIKVKPGQILTLPSIPKNADIEITEVGGEVDGYTYAGTTVKNDLGNTVTTTTVDKGVRFRMADNNITAVVQNNKYKYSLTYEYPAYITSYSNQSYTVDGYVTSEELAEYFTVTNGNLAFTNSTKQTDFLNNKAPYEDNFMTTLTVDSSTATTEYDAKNYTIKTAAEHPATFTTSATKLSVQLKLPYQVNSTTTTTDLTPKTNAGGKVVRSVQTYNLTNLGFLEWITTNGTGVDSTSGASDVSYVSAPLVVYDTDNTNAYHFLYWSVKSNPKAIGESVEYTRCYSKDFNFVIFQDSILEAVYSNKESIVDAESAASNFRPQTSQDSDAEGVTISFIENSRNQYNKFGSGGLATNSKRNIAGDRTYCDFLLSYNNVISGYSDNLNTLGSTYKCGVIIQAVQDLNPGENGYDTNLANYDKLASLSSNPTLKTNIENYIKGTGSLTHAAKSEFNVDQLDNKNRVEFYYSIANRKDNTLAASANSIKLYRAFSYIKTANNSDVYISDKPAYFTIYDIASIENGGTFNG